MRAKSCLLLLLLTALETGRLSAEDECCDPCCCPAISCQGEPFEPCELPAGYGRFAGIEVDGCADISVWGDFLYWKPFRRNRVDIYQFENDPANTILMRSEEAAYRPGFRVGMGITLPNFDDWSFKAVYTWYHHDFTRTFNAPEGQTVSPLAVPLLFVPFTSIRSTMKFDYDELALSIHRAMYLGCNLILDPYFGLSGIYRKTGLSQELTLPPGLFPQNGIGANFENAKINIWYVSMNAGGNAYYLFGPGFKALFKGEVGLAYLRITKNRSEVINNSFIPLPPVIVQEYPKHPWLIQGIATSGAGLGWGSYFCCQKYHVELSAIYELVGMWGGQLYEYNTVLFMTDTMFRGLTVQAQFDF